MSTTTDNAVVLTLTGEIDHGLADHLRQALHVSTPRPHVVIDLQRVTFLDSSGINVFLTAHDAPAEKGGWLRLAATPDVVMRILHIVGVDTVIDCRSTLHQALSD